MSNIKTTNDLFRILTHNFFIDCNEVVTIKAEYLNINITCSYLGFTKIINFEDQGYTLKTLEHAISPILSDLCFKIKIIKFKDLL